MSVTIASGIASLIFWTISLCTHWTSSPSLVCFSLSSFIDIASTIYVLFRFAKKNSLANTPENAALELRAAVVVDLSFVASAIIAIGFGTYTLAAGLKPKWAELKVMTWLTLPAQAVYLVIGMLQLQIGCRLRSNSLTKDGVLSVFSAIAGMVELMSAMFDVFTTTKYEYAAAWWIDPVSSLILSVVMFAIGCSGLLEQTRVGVLWWTPHFWTRRTMPVDEAFAKAEVAETGQVGTESSRLNVPQKG